MLFDLNGKKIRLTKQQFGQLVNDSVERIKQWEYYNRFGLYERKYPSYHETFCWFTPSMTGLKWTLCLDENCGYIHDKHPIFAFLIRSRGDMENAIPIAVHRFKPFLLDESRRPQDLTDKDLERVYNFIRKHYDAIVEYANDRIDYNTMVMDIKRRTFLNESLLCEMPVLQRKETGLPTKIWIDIKRQMSHQKRIKFEDVEKTHSTEWTSMTIDKVNPKVYNIHQGTHLTTHDIDMLKSFVRANYDILMELATDDTKNVDDMIPFMVFPKDLKAIVSDDTPIVNISFMARENRLVVVTDGKGYSKELIRKLITNNLFKSYEENSAYIEAYNISNEFMSASQVIKNYIYTAAKAVGCKVNFTHTSELEWLIGKVKELY